MMTFQFVTAVISIPQMSMPPAPPARKKYTLAEVFGDDDDDDDEQEDQLDTPAAGAVGRQAAMPGELMSSVLHS